MVTPATTKRALDWLWHAAWRSLREGWAESRGTERWCYRLGALLIVVGLAHLGVFAALGGTWEGPVSWRKPFTFGLSFGLTLITITWVASYLRLGVRAQRLWLGLFAAACALEVGLITLQAWRRVPSHYNLETPFDATIARTLALGGAALIVVVAAFTIVAFRRDRATAPSMLLAIRAGFLALSCALLVGASMIARGLQLVFAGHQQEAYAVAGALKPVHAVAMHGILVLPVLAWLLSLLAWDEARRVRLLAFTIAGYALAIGGVFVVALTGFAPAPAPIVGGAVALLGGLLMAGAGLRVVGALLHLRDAKAQ